MMTTKRNEQIAETYENNVKFAKAAAARKDARMLELYESIEEYEIEINEIDEVIQTYGDNYRLSINKSILNDEIQSARRQMKILQEEIKMMEHMALRTQEAMEVL